MVTKKTLESEALDKNVMFEFRSASYTIPPAKQWPLDVIEAQEEGKVVGFIKALLGDSQYKTLRKSATTIGDLDEFVGVMFESMDLDPGK